jgi:hypothetical protein
MVKPLVVAYVNDTVQEEPAFLRRMRAGFQQEDDKVDEKRRRRGSEEIIDQDEAPQVIISEKDKDKIAEEEARTYVAKREGVKVDKPKDGVNEKPPSTDTVKPSIPNKPKAESVSLGMKKAKKPNEGLKRGIEEEKDVAEGAKKSSKSTSRKEKKLKLSFEEDE